MNDRIIGIVGGMGPEASARLYLKIIRATSVEREQDHFRILIDSNPKIPDRTKAIKGEGESPVKDIVLSLKGLERGGASLACIPCMTSHYYFEEIKTGVSMKLVNAFEQMDKYIKHNFPNAKKIGVMCTDGTMKMGLFDKYLSDFKVIYPGEEKQKNNIMEAIYGEEGIKRGNVTGKPVRLIADAISELEEAGADVVIAGCTELGFVLEGEHFGVPVIDALDVLAESMVSLGGGD